MARFDPDESISRFMIASSRYRHFPYRSHRLILQKEVNQAKELDMAGVIFALVAFVGTAAAGHPQRRRQPLPNSSWSPPSNWRERDPRS